MSDINNLTSKILSDAEAKKEEILAKASEEKEKILQKKQNSAKALEKEILEKAKSEAATRKERTISSAELTARNEKLKAKQEVIADVFLESVDKLSSLDKDVQVKFIKDTILNLDIDGDEDIIVILEQAVHETFDVWVYVNNVLVDGSLKQYKNTSFSEPKNWNADADFE